MFVGYIFPKKTIEGTRLERYYWQFYLPTAFKLAKTYIVPERSIAKERILLCNFINGYVSYYHYGRVLLLLLESSIGI